jgi:hypothetical protein
MSTRDFRSIAAAAVRTALWLVGMLMVLAFPLQRAHSSLSHFRAHEARRSVVRHTLLARTPETATAKESHKRPTDFVAQFEDLDESEPATKNCAIPAIPVKFYLTRLKLGSPHTGGQDPLLD